MTLLVDLAGGSSHTLAAPLFLAQTGTPAPTPAVATSASTSPLPADAQSSGLANLIMPLFIVGVFLLFFAPQIKRNKDHQKLIAGLQPGDEVITSGGVFGVVTQVKPDRFVVEISKGVRIEINRANVEARVSSPAKADGDKDK